MSTKAELLTACMYEYVCMYGIYCSIIYTFTIASLLCAALRIHMSESTARILEKLGGYQLECRGEREVKVNIFNQGYTVHNVILWSYFSVKN